MGVPGIQCYSQIMTELTFAFRSHKNIPAGIHAHRHLIHLALEAQDTRQDLGAELRRSASCVRLNVSPIGRALKRRSASLFRSCRTKGHVTSKTCVAADTRPGCSMLSKTTAHAYIRCEAHIYVYCMIVIPLRFIVQEDSASAPTREALCWVGLNSSNQPSLCFF